MQINGIARQMLGPLQLDTSTPSPSGSTAATKSGKSAGPDLNLDGLGPSFHEILSKYDMKSISPREFSELVQELHAAGEIDDTELRELSRIRVELEQEGLDSDTPIDLLDFFEDKLRHQTAQLETARDKADPKAAAKIDERPFTAEAQRQLDWIKKFAIVQAAGSRGIDVGV